MARHIGPAREVSSPSLEGPELKGYVTWRGAQAGTELEVRRLQSGAARRLACRHMAGRFGTTAYQWLGGAHLD
jgi:hypothetical protein